jgi:hypothetical protein
MNGHSRNRTQRRAARSGDGAWARPRAPWMASAIVCAAAWLTALPFARAAQGDATAVSAPPRGAPVPGAARALTPLVPEVASAPFALAPGKRPFLHRLAFSPGFGKLGNERLFAFRLAYNPNRWLGYEAAIGHNPGASVHALFNTFNVLLRYPLPWRVQPYGSLGYGMMLVFPGRAFNADPVTKNALAFGGGLELYVRNDVALRVELRETTVIGGERNSGDTIAYQYGEATIGLSFYRTLGR